MLHSSHFFDDRCGIYGFWAIEESENTLADALRWHSSQREEFAQIEVPKKRLSWLAVRVLAQTLAQIADFPLRHIVKNNNGKPYESENNTFLSLSHTDHYAAVVLHSHKNVGIDLENLRPQLLKVAPRVLNANELKNVQSEREAAQFWCAKEALYKLHGTRGLDFKQDLNIKNATGELLGQTYDLHFHQLATDLMCCIAF